MTLTTSEKNMILSCFTYGQTWFGDNRYLDPIIERAGIKEVKKELKKLENTYNINRDVYTDRDDCTYNSLTKK